MHTYLHTYRFTNVHRSIHPYIHAYIHMYLHTSIHPSIHPSIHTYLPTYLPTYVRTYMRLSIIRLRLEGTVWKLALFRFGICVFWPLLIGPWQSTPRCVSIFPKEELVQANAARDAQEKRLAELTLVAMLLSVVTCGDGLLKDSLKVRGSRVRACDAAMPCFAHQEFGIRVSAKSFYFSTWPSADADSRHAEWPGRVSDKPLGKHGTMPSCDGCTDCVLLVPPSFPRLTRSANDLWEGNEVIETSFLQVAICSCCSVWQ